MKRLPLIAMAAAILTAADWAGAADEGKMSSWAEIDDGQACRLPAVAGGATGRRAATRSSSRSTAARSTARAPPSRSSSTSRA